MEGINEILKNYRRISGLSLDELQKRTGIPKSTLNRYENNPNQKIDIKTFSDIAKELEIPSNVIESIWNERGLSAMEVMVKIPVYNKLNASNGQVDEKGIVGYEITEAKYGSGEYFYYSVGEKSMSPQIDLGDIVLVKRQGTVGNGEVAMLIVGDKVMIKKIVVEKNATRLISFNPYYPELLFEGSNVEQIRIIGKIIESKRKW